MKKSLIALVFLILGVLLLPKGAVTSVATSKKLIALTFDDGPNPPYTGAVLDLLKKHSARATFFILGRNAQLFPEQMRALLGSGHELGNHGYSHQNFHSLWFPQQINEIKTTESLIKIFGYQKELFFRPPYGAFGRGLSFWLWATGRKTVLWSKLSLDYLRQDPRQITQTFLQDLAPGQIFLLHDGEGYREETVLALDWLLDALTKQGYQVVSVGDLLKEAK